MIPELVDQFFYFLETLGVLSFSISGLMVARRNNFDPVGSYIIACVTAFGGGTLRDILLDRQSIYWFQHPEYPLVILCLTVLFYVFKRISVKEKWLLIPDTMGLALFTLTGAKIAILAGMAPIIVAILATMTATFGGVIRDTLCNEVPIIFRKRVNLYSVTSFAGAYLYVGLTTIGIENLIASVSVFVFIVLFRLLAIRYNLQFE